MDKCALPKSLKQTSVKERDRRYVMGTLVLSLRSPLPGSTVSRLLNNPLRRRSKSLSDLSRVSLRQRSIPMENIPSEPQNGTEAKMPRKQQWCSRDYKTTYAELNEQYTKHDKTCRQEEYTSKILDLKAQIRLLKEENEDLSRQILVTA